MLQCQCQGHRDSVSGIGVNRRAKLKTFDLAARLSRLKSRSDLKHCT